MTLLSKSHVLVDFGLLLQHIFHFLVFLSVCENTRTRVQLEVHHNTYLCDGIVEKQRANLEVSSRANNTNNGELIKALSTWNHLCQSQIVPRPKDPTVAALSPQTRVTFHCYGRSAITTYSKFLPKFQPTSTLLQHHNQDHGGWRSRLVNR